MQENTLVLPYLFEPRDYQFGLYAALDSGRCNRALLRWSRRAGKDLTCFNYMIKKAVERVGTYFYFLPSYSQGRKIIWEGADKDGLRFLAHIPECLLKPQGGKNNNEMKIELINGSIIRIIGTDNIDSIVGTNPIGVVFSEFSLQDPQAWDLIRPILAENGGWAIFNGTPRGQNHMYKLETAVRGLDNWYFSELQSLWPDLPNYYPVISQEDIRKEREAGMVESLIEQEFGVSYSAGVQGAYFAEHVQKARDSGRIGNFPASDHAWVDTFWDLGFRDDNPIWFRQMDGKAKIWIDYYEDKGHDIAYYVQVLKAKGYNYRTHYVPHDAEQGKYQAGMSHKQMLIAALRSAGLSDDVVVVPKCNTKQQAIDATRSQFSYYYFNEKTTSDGLLKLALYHRKYDRARETFLDLPVHDWTSHAADAIMNDGLSINLQDDFTNPSTGKIITDFDPFDY